MTTQINKIALLTIVAVLILSINVVNAGGFSFLKKAFVELTQDDSQAEAETKQPHRARFTFRNVTWGVTQSQIEQSESEPLMYNGPTFLTYYAVIHTEAALISYRFQDDKLIAVEYEFQRPVVETEIYEALQAQFDSQYERSLNNSDVWSNSTTKVTLSTRDGSFPTTNNNIRGNCPTEHRIVVTYSNIN